MHCRAYRLCFPPRSWSHENIIVIKLYNLSCGRAHLLILNYIGNKLSGKLIEFNFVSSYRWWLSVKKWFTFHSVSNFLWSVFIRSDMILSDLSIMFSFSFCFANRLVLPFRFIFNLGVPICYVISLVSYATIHLNSQYNIFAKYFLCIFFCINFFIVVNNLLIFCMVFHFFGFSNIYIKNKADIYIYIYIYTSFVSVLCKFYNNI